MEALRKSYHNLTTFHFNPFLKNSFLKLLLQDVRTFGSFQRYYEGSSTKLICINWKKM